MKESRYYINFYGKIINVSILFNQLLDLPYSSMQ